ncbi:MAG: CDP-diacylglycerol--glycerol-3-phosphate 3-phosphatidyltransferase [Nitrospirales bacterium]|nr:CDP-diacylglycerol--glycerol-3-phosphate 3-phosphatidyltransferase [Nitrospirales bacterium]
MNPLRATETLDLDPQHQKWKGALNLPNLLTLSRIFLVPVFILTFSTPTVTRSWAAAFVFGVAALTDWFDGYLARRRAEVTTIGRLLDPIADKFLVVSGLILLVQFQRIAAWVAIIFIVREIVITGMRAIAATEGVVISAGSLGKYKVILQIFGILILILQDAVSLPFVSVSLLGNGFLYMALGFSLVSGAQYFARVFGTLKLSSSHDRRSQ